MAGRRAYAAIVVAVLSVSFASLFFRWAESPPLVKSFYRLALATLILLPILAFRRADLDSIRRLTRRDVLLLLGIGLVLALHFATWVTSLELTTVAASTLLVTAHPLVVGLISHYYMKEGVERWIVVGMALGLAGAFVIAIGDYGGSNVDPLAGDVLAFTGGVMAAIYILAGRRLRQRMELLPYVVSVYGAASIFLLLMVVGSGLSPLPSASTRGPWIELLLFIALAVVSSIGGHTLYNWALKYVPATVVSVSLLGEPLCASVWALIFLAEVPGYNVFVGAPLILVGVYIAARPPPKGCVAERDSTA